MQDLKKEKNVILSVAVTADKEKRQAVFTVCLLACFIKVKVNYVLI